MNKVFGGAKGNIEVTMSFVQTSHLAKGQWVGCRADRWANGLPLYPLRL
ncbi:MAG TPA: hypothetical protein VNK04_10910 [Gemmataceae bacterium]|nr:hypothetical protein [Gemmataceae bacterium]